MIQLAGRFRLDLSMCWSLTPGEFEDLVAGAVEGERVARYGHALVASFVAATAGKSIKPETLLGEEDDHGENPFGEDTTAEKYARMKARLAKKADDAAAAAFPAGIDLTEDGRE